MRHTEYLLLQLETVLSITPVTGASGKVLPWYCNVRKVLHQSRALFSASRCLSAKLSQLGAIDSLGTLGHGAAPLLGALLNENYLSGWRSFTIRAAPKEHGLGGRICGDLQAGDEVVLIDDVATSGGSLLQAAEVVQAANASVALCLVVLDRQEGAREALRERDIELRSLFTAQDLQPALNKLRDAPLD